MSDPGRSRVLVRRATEEDAAAIAPLLGVLGYPASAGDVAPRLRRVGEFGHAVVLVATIDDAVAGVITAHAFPTVHAAAPAAWITALAVASDAQRRGVGRHLVRAVEAWATERGAVRIAVTSGLQRADAHQFYEGLGYARSGLRFHRGLADAGGAPGG